MTEVLASRIDGSHRFDERAKALPPGAQERLRELPPEDQASLSKLVTFMELAVDGPAAALSQLLASPVPWLGEARHQDLLPSVSSLRRMGSLCTALTYMKWRPRLGSATDGTWPWRRCKPRAGATAVVQTGWLKRASR